MRINNIYIALTILATVSCTGVIEYLDDDTSYEIVVNMQTSTAAESHTVFVSKGYRQEVKGLEGAEVTILVNGDEVCKAVQEEKEDFVDAHGNHYSNEWHYREQARYLFDHVFKPGDRVGIRVEYDGRTALAQTVVPDPGTVEKLDTMSVNRKDILGEMSGFLEYSAALRDVDGEDTYYRVEMIERKTVTGHFEQDGMKVRDDITEYIEEPIDYYVFSDPVLLDGYPSMTDDNILADFTPVNSMNVFSDRLFRDSGRTVRTHVMKDGYQYAYFVFRDPDTGAMLYASSVDMVGETVFRLMTIDRIEFNYLKAINNFQAYGYDSSFIIEPTSLPTNVSGGIGVVSVASVSEMAVSLERFGVVGREVIYY